MITVQAKTKNSVGIQTVAELGTAKPVVTAEMFEQAAALASKYSAAKKLSDEAEKACKAATEAVLLTLTGCKTMDEVKVMDADAIAVAIEKRVLAGDVDVNQALFSQYTFRQTSAQTRPEWKAIAYKLAGQVKADAEAAHTPKTFSYRVEKL